MMSTPEQTTPRTPFAKPSLLGLSALLAAFSLLWIGAEQHYGACVSAQVAKYPPVGVSAFTTKTTGPLKVAYDAERRAAVGKCKRFLFV